MDYTYSTQFLNKIIEEAWEYDPSLRDVLKTTPRNDPAKGGFIKEGQWSALSFNQKSAIINAIEYTANSPEFQNKDPLAQSYALDNLFYYLHADKNMDHPAFANYKASNFNLNDISKNTILRERATREITSQPLFEGQTNQPLSVNEIEMLFKRLHFQTRTPKLETKIKADIIKTLQYEEVRAQARELISFEPKDRVFTINCGVDGEKERVMHMRNSMGETELYSCVIHLREDITASNTNIGPTVFHELLHTRQNAFLQRQEAIIRNKEMVFPTNSYVLLDAEPQAFNAELSMEMGENKDLLYISQYEKYKANWEKIADNPELCPAGYPKFQPKENLSLENIQKAKELYACQMASKQVKAEYIRLFIGNPTRFTSLELKSYDMYRKRISYIDDDLRSRSGNNNDVARSIYVEPKLVADLTARYPALKESDFNFLRDISNRSSLPKDTPTLDYAVSFYNFANKERNKQLADQLKHEEHPRIKECVQKLREGKPLTKNDQYLLQAVIIKNTPSSKMNLITKEHQMMYLINWHYANNDGKERDDRDIMVYMLRTFSQKDYPFVRNKNINDILHTNGQEVLPEQNIDLPINSNTRLA